MKKIFVFALILGLSLSPFAQAKMVFRQGGGSEPQTIDPGIATGHPDAHVILALFEGLLAYHPETLAVVPGVAERWETSPDGLTYTFYLRKNAKWSNGDPVTAHDFVYSWNRFLHPLLASEYAYMLYYIKNAKDFNMGKITDFSQVGVKAVDDTTLVVTLEKPTPYFLQIMQFAGTFPVHKPTIEKFGGMTARNSEWTKPGQIVTNGPFNLKSWTMNDKIVIEKSQTYWDKDNVKLDEVEIYSVDNILTEEKMFRSGMIQKTYEFPPEKIEVYRKEMPESLMLNAQLSTYYYWFNIESKPLDNVDVRKALYFAIDRQAITDYVTKTNIPAYTFIPENTGNYHSKIKASFDVNKAKEYLAKAGYPDGKGFPTVQLLYNTSENHRKIAEAIQQMWKKNLNINIELVNQDWKVYLDALNGKNFQIARAGWIGDYNDPNTFFEQVLSTSGTNRSGYANPVYDKVILDSQVTLDPAKRTELFDKADQILFDDMPLMPIYYYVKPCAISPKVKGWYPTLLDAHPLKNVYIEP